MTVGVSNIRGMISAGQEDLVHTLALFPAQLQRGQH